MRKKLSTSPTTFVTREKTGKGRKPHHLSNLVGAELQLAWMAELYHWCLLMIWLLIEAAGWILTCAGLNCLLSPTAYCVCNVSCDLLSAGKEVRHGAEHQECSGQTDSGSAATAHQPAGNTHLHLSAGNTHLHLSAGITHLHLSQVSNTFTCLWVTHTFTCRQVTHTFTCLQVTQMLLELSTCDWISQDGWWWLVETESILKFFNLFILRPFIQFPVSWSCYSNIGRSYCMHKSLSLCIYVHTCNVVEGPKWPCGK